MTITYPLDLINSKNWKFTTPESGAPEIKFPALATYTSQWMHLNDAGDGVVFMARTDGGHTSGSLNPRSELREMKADGTNASWSTTSGAHSMEIEKSVDALPIGSKPHVVVGQIHNASDDVTVFRVEGSLTDRTLASIWITKGDTTHGHLVTDNYKLGDKFTVGFEVFQGQIEYTFNGVLLGYTYLKKTSGCYFKAGSYNQSGGIVTPLPDGQADYAEVTIYALQVCHDGVCTGNAPGTIIPPVTDGSIQALTGAVSVAMLAFQASLATSVATLTAALKAAIGKLPKA